MGRYAVEEGSMAFARLASAPVVKRPPVTLLYARAEGEEPSLLDARLAVIVDHYQPHVRLQTLSPDELARSPYAHLAGPTPAVFVLRKGELVGHAIGSMLPHRELDAVVRCAVEWPEC